jgi:hypothetical protein
LLAHLTHGADPVRHRRGDQFFWTVQDHRGSLPERIADAIVAEWEAEAVRIPTLAGFGSRLHRPPIILKAR